MLVYALQRLMLFPLTLFLVYSGAVLLVLAAPGDPLESGLRDLPAEALEAKRRAYNYDQPWWQRYYWTWPKRLFWDGDLPAHQYEDWTVAEILRASLPISFQLGAVAFGLAVTLGIGVGVLAARYRGGWIEALTLAFTLIGVALPMFVVGALLIIVFGVWLRWAPVGGWGGPGQVILPAIALALPYAAYLARLTRAALLDASAEDYLRTARAKGLTRTQALLRHALPNALLPALSYMGPAAAAIFTGSFVVEKLFAIPGMGTHVVESINNRDQSMILATVMVYALLLCTFNLTVDLLYGAFDPRVRIGSRTEA